MLALYLDGVDSAFGVLRFVGAATHGTPGFHMEWTVYANTLRYLYMEGHATKFGFTRYALQNVARRRVFFVKGVPRSFGGAGCSFHVDDSTLHGSHDVLGILVISNKSK